MKPPKRGERVVRAAIPAIALMVVAFALAVAFPSDQALSIFAAP
jgi:hypothetical protein